MMMDTPAAALDDHDHSASHPSRISTTSTTSLPTVTHLPPTSTTERTTGSNTNSNPNPNPTQPSTTTTTTPGVKRRAPNWIPQEEEQLAISWLHVSRQPEFIHNQTSEIFYKKVAEHFNLHCSIHYREPNQVRIRWCVINTITLKFSAIYGAIERSHPENTSPTDWILMAKKEYTNQTNGQVFKHDIVWDILRHAPKWRLQSNGGPQPNLYQLHQLPTVLESNLPPPTSSSTITINNNDPSPSIIDPDDQNRSDSDQEDPSPNSHQPANHTDNNTTTNTNNDDQNHHHHHHNNNDNDNLGNHHQLIIGQKRSKRMRLEREEEAKKLKLLSESNRLAEKRLEEIRLTRKLAQEEFLIKQRNSDLELLMKNEIDFPDEESKQVLRSMKAQLYRKYKDRDPPSSSSN